MVENVDLIIESATNKLKNAGYKLTPQRALTIETLVEYGSQLLTAEEIFALVNRKNSSVGLATVYRTLDMLEQLKIIRKVQFLDDLMRYDIVMDENPHEPYFLVCTACKKIEEIKEDILFGLQDKVEEKYHFEIERREVIFHGLCRNCQKKDRV